MYKQGIGQYFEKDTGYIESFQCSDGNPVEIVYHKCGSVWKITEYSTGFSLPCMGKTRMQALDNLMEHYTWDKIQQAIDNNRKAVNALTDHIMRQKG